MGTRKRTAILIVLAVAVCAFTATLYERYTQSVISKDQFIERYEPGSADEREAVAGLFLKSYPAQELLSLLEARYPVCHSQAHDFGKAVYTETQNLGAAVASCSNSCNNGCFHGALMRMFSTESDNFGGEINDETAEGYFAHVRELAKDLCSRPEVAARVLPISCVHGLGHVFAYTSDYDVKKSIEACETLGSPTKARMCAGGVYMEYGSNKAVFDTLQRQDFYPCDASAKYLGQCFLYKGAHSIRARGSVQNAIEACRTLGSESALLCIRGVAFGATKHELLRMHDGLRTICSGDLNTKERAACVSGAVFRVVANLDGTSSAQCDSMDPEYRPICVRQLEDQLSIQL